MSTPLENSPVSDTKMDISESATTISQDSPVTSPDVHDSLVSDNRTVADSTTIPITSTRTLSSTTTASHNPIDTIDSDNNDEKIVLDNRIDINDDNECLANSHVNSTIMSRSGFTLANSHPLMSPLPPEDSPDSLGLNNFSYPDVVPDHEPLRLANPNPICTPTTSELQSHIRPNLPLDVLPDNTHTDNYNDQEISSGESEPDVSQYQASVEPTFQAVSLIANSSSIKLPGSPKINTRRKIPVSSELLSGDDVSSVETFSNNSFDNAPFDDEFIANDGFNNEPNINSSNLVSASVSSSLLDDAAINEMSATASMTKMNAISNKYDEPRIESAMTPSSTHLEPLPQYTAVEEIRDSRNWQKVTLPNGKIRDIDMKVIEPYKRVLSHGGYLKAGGHNAIVVFSACYLPDRSRTDYHYVMDNLFLYVVKTLEQLVTEDYVLVYLHGGSTRNTVPSFQWLKKCYQLLDRRLRKSLKNLFMVHPTFWLKSMVWMARPFISSKFWRKLIYVGSLEDLYKLVPVEKAAVPDKVKKYDAKYT